MTALTYDEAHARARLIDPLGYHIGLDLTGGDEVFGSVTVVRFGCRVPGAGSFIEIRPARLRRVVLNGQDLDPASLEGNRLMSSESVEASRRKAVAQEQTAAQDDVVDCVTELELLTDNSDLVALARESMRAAFGITQQTVKPYSSAASKLQVSLRSDLRDGRPDVASHLLGDLGNAVEHPGPAAVALHRPVELRQQLDADRAVRGIRSDRCRFCHGSAAAVNRGAGGS